MKKSIVRTVKQFTALFLFNFLALIAFAQEKATGTTTTTRSETYHFTMQPWMWVVGGVIVLIILIALFRGGGTDKTVTRTTIIRET